MRSLLFIPLTALVLTATATPLEDSFRVTEAALSHNGEPIAGVPSTSPIALGKGTTVTLVQQPNATVTAHYTFRRMTAARSEHKQTGIAAEIVYTLSANGRQSKQRVERTWFAGASREIHEKVTFSLARKRSMSNDTYVLTYTAQLPE